ncbi:MAG: hypothetical protein P9L92_15220 [Candidatus Electryonea clarkiae]|nr:hypothetical protein [Candidatus Electryonea clarkiae]MDP8287531.1 hypothetical protein [Candidatus Electryonea clarkiae]
MSINNNYKYREFTLSLFLLVFALCFPVYASFWKPSKAWNFYTGVHKNTHLYNYGSGLPYIENDYINRFCGYPRYFLWEGDTTNIDLNWQLEYRSLRGPGQNYTWGQLREYFFWEIEDTEGDTNFYAPCTLGVDSIHVGGATGYGMYYAFSIDAWDLPIPADSIVFGVKLLLFDTTATTGTVLAQVDSFSILNIPVNTAMDSLLWIMGNNHKSLANLEYITAKFPRSYKTQKRAFNKFWNEREWAKARVTLLRMISILENDNDSTPLDPKIIEEMKGWAVAGDGRHNDPEVRKKLREGGGTRMGSLRVYLEILEKRIAEEE